MLEHQQEALAKGFHIGSATGPAGKLVVAQQAAERALTAFKEISLKYPLAGEIEVVVFEVLMDAALEDLGYAQK